MVEGSSFREEYQFLDNNKKQPRQDMVWGG